MEGRIAVKARDLILLGGIAAIAAVAAVDELTGWRNSPDVASEAATAPDRGGDGASGETAAAVTHVDHGDLGGRILFTGRDCSLGELELAFPEPVTRVLRDAGCGLWAPPASDRVAYGVSPADEAGIRFRVLDLSQGDDGATYRAGWRWPPFWSRDGQRLAWCDLRGRGFELEQGGRPRPLADCPDAYAPDGSLAYLRGRDVVVGGRTVRRAPWPINAVSFGEDGSIAVVGRREILLYSNERDRYPRAGVETPPGRGAPIFESRNCGALLRSPHRGEPPTIRLVPLGCHRIRGGRRVPGNDAAWSPDGEWFAVAEPDAIVFYRTRDPAHEFARINVWANQLVWKRS